jgi:hypothetical protein
MVQNALEYVVAYIWAIIYLEWRSLACYAVLLL